MGLLQHIEHQISALNDLIKINNDRITGYQKHSETITDGDLLDLFPKFIVQSQQNITELKDYLLILGGSPAEGTTLSGKFYHTWIDLKAKFTQIDRAAILDYCEAGEEVASASYRKALDDKELIWKDDKVVAILKKQYDALKKSYTVVKALKDAEINAG